MNQESNTGHHQKPVKPLVGLIGSLALVNALLIIVGVFLRPASVAGIWRRARTNRTSQCSVWLLAGMEEARSGQTRRADRRCADSVCGSDSRQPWFFCSEILLEYVFLPDAAMNGRMGGSSSERCLRYSRLRRFMLH